MENDKWRNNRTCPVRVVLVGVLVYPAAVESLHRLLPRDRYGMKGRKFGARRFFFLAVIVIHRRWTKINYISSCFFFIFKIILSLSAGKF